MILRRPIIVASMIASVILFGGQAGAGSEKKWLVLSSGDEEKITEAWYVTASKLKSLPAFDPSKSDPPVTIRQAVALALAHATKRYPSDTFIVTDVTLQRFADKTTAFPNGMAKDWVYLVYLQYNQEGAVQIVPVLLNSTILESDSETEAP